LQALLAREVPANKADRGRSAIFAGKALLDMGPTNLSRAAALKIEYALVQAMQSVTSPIRIRRDAGDLLGHLGWAPDAQEGDVLLAPDGYEPTGLDAFRPVPGMNVWIGKYPVTNRQFALFIAAGGYDCPEGGSKADWAWRTWTYYSKASKGLRDPCDRPYLWDDRKWNSPLFPVVGITWLEAAAYTRWLSEQLRSTSASKDTHEVREGLMTGRLMVRLPLEAEWQAAIGGHGAYPWGARFDPSHLNCAESWAGRRLSSATELHDWVRSDAESSREASTTAVTTYPQGVSKTGVWDASGNVSEWMDNPYAPSSHNMALRGGAWNAHRRRARVSSRNHTHFDNFYSLIGVRVVVGPVLTYSPSPGGRGRGEG
jgi:formylglycine-generating enzyme required for sulfatase activity